jgi:hypothetical protein
LRDGFDQEFVNSHSILIKIEDSIKLESTFSYYLVTKITFFAQKINTLVSGGFATNSAGTCLTLDMFRERVLHNESNIGDTFHD